MYQSFNQMKSVLRMSSRQAGVVALGSTARKIAESDIGSRRINLFHLVLDCSGQHHDHFSARFAAPRTAQCPSTEAASGPRILRQWAATPLRALPFILPPPRIISFCAATFAQDLLAERPMDSL